MPKISIFALKLSQIEGCPVSYYDLFLEQNVLTKKLFCHRLKLRGSGQLPQFHDSTWFSVLFSYFQCFYADICWSVV